MPLESLGPLLDKYRSLRPPNEAVRKAVCEVIQATVGVRVEEKQIVIRGRTVYADVPAHVKMALHTQQENIQKRLHNILGSKTPKEIR